jgi:hypothetical protein
MASRANSGQQLVHQRRTPLSIEHAWNKEEVAASQKWLPYHLPEGYSGVTGARTMKTEAEREQSNGGEFPKTLTPSASIDITRTLELEHTTLSISRSTLSLWDLFVLQIKSSITRISSFFSRCTMLDRSNISFFYLRILIIYIKIWHIYYNNNTFCSSLDLKLSQALRL